MNRTTFVASLACSAALLFALPASAVAPPQIVVLSNRADLVAGGDALVEIKWPAGANSSMAKIALNGVAVNSAFAMRPNGRYMGLVTGLRDGFNVLTARVPGAGSEITITNHPIGGPVFSGPQVQPWTCSTTSNPSLGPATDAQCNAPTQYRYVYRTTANAFAAYDPNAARPANMATTTTDQGITVDYIVRIERGTMNRGIHEIAVLFDATKPWSPWQPQPQWNHKVLMLYGAGTSQVYSQSTPGSVQSNEPLSRGFAVATSSMMINSLHANFVTAAETTMMLKERIVETLGEIRYTIGEGASGGALLQHLTADNYPGLLDGLRITNAQDWEESISGAYREFADSGALVHAFTTSSLTYTTQDRAAIGGWGAANVNVFNIETGRLPDYNQPDDGTSCAGAASYNATTNPTGTRCTFQDFMSSILGTRPQDGYANLVFDNVGVQYGYTALLAGTITPDKFVDVNARAGGYDVNGVWQPQRSEMTADVAALLHRTGNVTFGKYLGKVPEIATRSTNNNDYHYPFRTYVNRARLIAQNGTAANHVFWTAAPSTVSTLAAMDRWLAAVEADPGALPIEQKVINDRPADIVNACWIGGLMQPDQKVCDATYPYFREPRTVAGEAWTIYTMKCQLKALVPGDYPGIAFTADQWATLQATFPSGVCDWSKPGVGFQPNVPWLSYQGGPGGQPLGDAPAWRPLQ